MSGQGSYQLIHNPLCNGDSSDEEDQPTEGWPDEVCLSACLPASLSVYVYLCVYVYVCVFNPLTCNFQLTGMKTICIRTNCKC